MSKEVFKSRQFNGISWRVSYLGEQVILLECSKEVPIEKIHQSSHTIVSTLGEKLFDIVPTYHSIAVFTPLNIEEFFELLENSTIHIGSDNTSNEIVELPICYDFGLDLERLEQHTGCSADQLISLHMKGTYRCLFIGFTPGFVYADGLNKKLECPRLEKPRKKVLAGSVGIAGDQTGIYSLDSPGGWNIIGRTPIDIFRVDKRPPMLMDVGTRYKFYPITKVEFEEWGS
ncbi:5-oxoprolinase subunit B family protein [Ekhidna sp.]